MAKFSFLNQVANPLMRRLLQSPLHFIVSKNTLLLCYKGRKSGRAYQTPVNYVADGDTLRVISFRERKWWRNLRGGVPATLFLRGQERAAWADAVEQETAVTTELQHLLPQAPHLAKYLAIDETLPAEQIGRAAQTRIIVKLKLT